jgi:hypothetical protein
VFVAERRLATGLIRDDPDENYLVRLATGSRVALSFIHAGGLSGQSMLKGQLVIPRRPMGSQYKSILAISDQEFFAPTDHRTLADYTGGIAAFYQYAEQPLTYLDRATRFQYRLGYYPTADLADSAHRRIRILVNRPDVKALYRHGYQVHPPAVDAKEFRRVIADARIAAAMARLADTPPGHIVPHWRSPLKLSGIVLPGAGDTEQVKVSASFDPARVTFIKTGNDYRASLDLGVTVDDVEGTPVGERVERIELTLSAPDFERTKREWLACDVTVAVKGHPARVRAVLYDYDTDRAASASGSVVRK